MRRAAGLALLAVGGASAGAVEVPALSAPDLAGSTAAAPGVYHFPLSRRLVRAPLPPGDNSSVPARGRVLQDEVPVYGDFRQLAYYYADVFVGTPAQKFTVITDTGSCALRDAAAAAGGAAVTGIGGRLSSHVDEPPHGTLLRRKPAADSVQRRASW
jgi:hypothetical protein